MEGEDIGREIVVVVCWMVEMKIKGRDEDR